MADWLTALVAAAAALAGSIAGGMFAVRGARRQADAAVTAALTQVRGQLAVMDTTLRDQAAAAQRAVRRTAYVAFLGRIDKTAQAQRAWIATPTATTRSAWTTAADALDESLNVIRLEGPEAVATAAADLTASVTSTGATPNAYQQAYDHFLTTARAALQPPP